MTLTKAYMELLDELQRDDITEYEKEALIKYSAWLSSIKSTVTNNKEFGTKLHPYPKEKPTEEGYYVCRVDWSSKPCEVLKYEFGDWWLDYSEPISDVIAWAELPEPYKEGNNG